MNRLNHNHLFWIITLGIAFSLTLPVLIQDGMFMDGELYAAVSHNLANGIGTFWFPYFSHNNIAGIANSFHEQPPLFFAFQSIFFKVLGSSLYVERFFTFLMFLASIFLISKLWKLINLDNIELQKLSWLPVLLWSIIPVCFWSYSNNMIENMLTVIVLLNVILQLTPFFKPTDTKKTYLYFILSGLLLFTGFLTKGLPALFPVVLPFILAYFFNKYTYMEATRHFLIMIITFFMCLVLVLLSEAGKESLYNYVFLRLFNRVQNVPTTANRFDTLYRLLTELIIPFVFVFIVKFYGKGNFKDLNNRPMVITFLFLGLSGIIPLLLTMVQKGFYMVPALPFFSISLSIYVASDINRIVASGNKIFKLMTKSFAIITPVLLFTLLLINFGGYARDEEKLKDLKLISLKIPEKTIFQCSPSILEDWSLRTYGARYYYYGFETEKNEHHYFITTKDVNISLDTSYKKMNFETNFYEVYSVN
ncbi:MAG: ArnT family glycosyltransferase [Bacteroidia bacterium]